MIGVGSGLTPLQGVLDGDVALGMAAGSGL